jgi:hypothetical protein
MRQDKKRMSELWMRAEHTGNGRQQMTVRSKSAAAAKLGNPDARVVTDLVHVSKLREINLRRRVSIPVPSTVRTGSFHSKNRNGLFRNHHDERTNDRWIDH